MRAIAFLAISVLYVGCVPPEGRYRCADRLECPTGWSCRDDGRCYSTPGTTGDGGMPFDAGPLDAPGLDTPGLDAPGTDAPGADVPGLDAPASDAGCVCPNPPHGSGSCATGTCVIDCDTPFQAVTFRGGTRCSLFGGVFLGEPATCETPNPYTGGCSCPAGFRNRIGPLWSSGGPTLHVCEEASFTAMGGYGGVHLLSSGAGCQFSNAGGTGSCSCPASTPTQRIWYGQNASDDLTLSFCGGPLTNEEALRDAFVRGCDIPACTGLDGCTCPAGSEEVVFPTVYGTTCTGTGGEAVLCLAIP